MSVEINYVKNALVASSVLGLAAFGASEMQANSHETSPHQAEIMTCVSQLPSTEMSAPVLPAACKAVATVVGIHEYPAANGKTMYVLPAATTLRSLKTASLDAQPENNSNTPAENGIIVELGTLTLAAIIKLSWDKFAHFPRLKST